MRWFLSVALVLLTLTTPTLAQSRSTRYTRPSLPPAAALDRLNLKIAWYTYVPMDGKRDGFLHVQLTRDDIFVQTRSGMITLLDPETGKSRWRARVGKPYEPVLPLTYNKRGVYVIQGTDLFALDRNTGVRQWRFRTAGGVTSPPVADEEQIYAATADTRIYAYFLPRLDIVKAEADPEDRPPSPGNVKSELYEENRKSTGAIGIGLKSIRDASRKFVEGPQPRQVWRELTTETLHYRPVLTSEFVVTASSTGRLLAFTKYPLSNSTTVEHFTYNLRGRVTVPPGRFGETVYVATREGDVFAFNVPSGRTDWRYTSGTPITSRPYTIEDDVYVNSAELGLTRLNRKTGAPTWRVPRGRQLLEANPEADDFLAVNNKFVYAFDKVGRLLVLSRRLGNKLSHYDTRDYVYPIPNEVTDRLYLAAHNGLLVCLHDKEYPKPLLHRRSEEAISNPLKNLLNKEITRVADPRPQLLNEVLAKLTKEFKLKFRISDLAFKTAGLEPVGGKPVKVPDIERQPLKELLITILKQVDARYETVEDTLIILPEAKK